jgi:hypothetical protein
MYLKQGRLEESRQQLALVYENLLNSLGADHERTRAVSERLQYYRPEKAAEYWARVQNKEPTNLDFEGGILDDGCPDGWSEAGIGTTSSKPGEGYSTGVNADNHHGGSAGAFIAGTGLQGNGFIRQCIDPAVFHGRRLRLTAYAKSEIVEGKALLWIGQDLLPGQSFDFDHVALPGTSDWKLYQIVTDVPDIVQNICFGCVFRGKGTIWLDDLKLEIVAEMGAGSTPTG